MEIYDEIMVELSSAASASKAVDLARFFRTSPGQYGYGDRFLGVCVPQTRGIVARLWRRADVDDVDALLASPWHEARLAGFLILVNRYAAAERLGDEAGVGRLVRFYLDRLDRGNNWDLVDLVAPKILGRYLLSHPALVESTLSGLAGRDDSLWHRRVAIVSTMTLIRKGIYEPTLVLSRRFLTQTHDLMHKSTGWMLREVGKYGGASQLRAFLDRYAAVMPRTMLRYAIEHFDVDERRYYMGLKKDMGLKKNIR